MSHAVLAPSSAGIWGHCSQYPWEAQRYPEVQTPQSREGTAAHWVGSEVLEQYRAGNDQTAASDYLGKTDPDGTVIDEKMADGAGVYVEEACRLAELVGGWTNCIIEGRVAMPTIHAQNWGTLDLAFYAPARKTIYLRDYKHGHRDVSPEGNLQLIDYMMGLCETLNINGRDDQEMYFDIGIVQPFAYHPDGAVRNWVGKLADLRGRWDQLHFKAHEAFRDPKMCAGEWCRDCPSLKHNACRAATLTAYGVIDSIERPVQYDAMSGKDLATFFEQLDNAQTLIKAMRSAVEEELKHRVGQGEADTGMAVQTSQGHPEWTVEPAVAIRVMKQLGLDVSKPGVITPTQAKAAAPKEMKEAVEQTLKAISKRPSRGTKLIKAQDRHVARAFSK